MVIYDKEEKSLVIPNGLGNFEGQGGEGRLQSKTVFQNTETKTYYPDADFYGIWDITVDASQYGAVKKQEGYTEGYSEGRGDGFEIGYESGVTTQKAKLVSTAVTENGIIEREDGFSRVEVEVPVENWFNSGYTSGYSEGFGVGYSSGNTDGFADGYESGATDGFNNGYSSGRTDGYADGTSDGYNQALGDVRRIAEDLEVTENGIYSADVESSRYFKQVNVNVVDKDAWNEAFLDGMFNSGHAYPSGTTVIYLEDHTLRFPDKSLMASGTAEVTGSVIVSNTTKLTSEAPDWGFSYIRGGSFSDWTSLLSLSGHTIPVGTYEYKYNVSFGKDWGYPKQLKPDGQCGFLCNSNNWSQPFPQYTSAGNLITRYFYFK